MSETVSPDRMWKAEVDESFCQSPFLTDITDEVRLVSMYDSSRTGYILNVNTAGNASERPRIAWTAPNHLRAIVPFPSEMKVGESAFEGIHVDIRPDPGDPASQAAWRREFDDPHYAR